MAVEQDNGAIVRRFMDLVWNRGELSAIDDLVDDDFTNFGASTSCRYSCRTIGCRNKRRTIFRFGRIRWSAS